jgi:hypothetical protein
VSGEAEVVLQTGADGCQVRLLWFGNLVGN